MKVYKDVISFRLSWDYIIEKQNHLSSNALPSSQIIGQMSWMSLLLIWFSQYLYKKLAKRFSVHLHQGQFFIQVGSTTEAVRLFDIHSLFYEHLSTQNMKKKTRENIRVRWAQRICGLTWHRGLFATREATWFTFKDREYIRMRWEMFNIAPLLQRAVESNI